MDTLAELLPNNRAHFFSIFIHGDTLGKVLPENTGRFPQNWYQTTVKLPVCYYQTIHTFFRICSTQYILSEIIRELLTRLPLTGFGMLDFFTNLSLMEFQVRCLALFHLFSVIGGFRWFWMRSFDKNNQLILQFLKASF